MNGRNLTIVLMAWAVLLVGCSPSPADSPSLEGTQWQADSCFPAIVFVLTGLRLIQAAAFESGETDLRRLREPYRYGPVRTGLSPSADSS
jgi:hypothetical protein